MSRNPSVMISRFTSCAVVAAVLLGMGAITITPSQVHAGVVEVLVSTFDNKVYRFDPSGNLIGSYDSGFGTVTQVYSIALRPDDGFYMVDYQRGGNRIGAHNPDGTVDTTWGTNGLGGPAFDATRPRFTTLSYVDPNDPGAVITGTRSQASPNQVQISRVTAFSTHTTLGYVQVADADALGSPLLRTSDNTLFALITTSAGAARGVYRYDDTATGNFVEFINQADGVVAFAWDAQGEWLYVRIGNGFYRYDDDGVQDPGWSIIDATLGAGTPGGFAVGPDGHLWASFEGTGAADPGFIRRYDIATGQALESKFIDVTGIGGQRITSFVFIIPEPGTLLLLAGGGMFILMRRRTHVGH